MLSLDGETADKNVFVSSAAVLNRSKALFPKAASALKAEGFCDEELASFKPCFKSQDKARFVDADVIIGMSRFHKYLLPRGCKGKYVTLSEAAEGKYTPIPDPFLARTQEEYDKAMAVIKQYLVEYFNRLKKDLVSTI